MAAIVVPFRGAGGKQRLRPLPDQVREEIALAMLGDVLAAATNVGPTIVATSDAGGLAVAHEHGADVVDDAGRGQGAAVADALRDVDGAALVVNSDVPCIAPADVRALERATPDEGIALVAARDGTTNALGLSDAGLFAPLYGPASAERFRLHAVSLGVDVVPAAIPNLADDVDTMHDLARLQFRVGPRTLAVDAR